MAILCSAGNFVCRKDALNIAAMDEAIHGAIRLRSQVGIGSTEDCLLAVCFRSNPTSAAVTGRNSLSSVATVRLSITGSGADDVCLRILSTSTVSIMRINRYSYASDNLLR